MARAVHSGRVAPTVDRVSRADLIADQSPVMVIWKVRERDFLFFSGQRGRDC